MGKFDFWFAEKDPFVNISLEKFDKITKVPITSIIHVLNKFEKTIIYNSMDKY